LRAYLVFERENFVRVAWIRRIAGALQSGDKFARITTVLEYRSVARLALEKCHVIIERGCGIVVGAKARIDAN